MRYVDPFDQPESEQDSTDREERNQVSTHERVPPPTELDRRLAARYSHSYQAIIEAFLER